MTKRLIPLLLLLALCVPVASQARGLVVVERPNYLAAYNEDRAVAQQVDPLLRVLNSYGSNYTVLPATSVTTEMARTGLVYKKRTANGTWGFDAASATEQFSWVIHVAFNGTTSARVTTYRPDSLTVFPKLPTVPQLMLPDPYIYAGTGAFMDNAATCSTWVSIYQPSGGGSGNHEGEGTMWVPGTTWRMFDTIFGNSMVLKSGSPNGGIRPLLCVGANAVMTNLELTGNMPLDVDSLNYAVTDTVKVWEKLNLHKAGAARIIFADVFGVVGQDSTQAANASTEYAYDTQRTVNYPALMVALAHLDSLTGGDVLGSKKVQQWGAVVTGGGTTSDRRHPGGLFRADTSIAKTSGDSTATTGVKLTVAADPESLAVNAGDIAMWKRFGQVRFTPWVRVGLDTLALGANGKASYARPVDVWGRYRNRAIYGDSLYHYVAGSDTSVFTLYSAARAALSALVGSGSMSRTIVAPDLDWTPYQVRANQNAGLIDSLAWVAAKLGCPTFIVTSYGRDNDPSYLANPNGWNVRQGTYTVRAASQRGDKVTFLATAGLTIQGSRTGGRTDGLSFLSYQGDSLPPLCSPGPCPSPSVSVCHENKFWNGFFGPAVDFNATNGVNNFDTVYDNYNRGPHGPAKVIVLPAQSFGGQCTCGPNRWGFFVLKHLMGATNAINYMAGRTVIANAWPEDIQP